MSNASFIQITSAGYMRNIMVWCVHGCASCVCMCVNVMSCRDNNFYDPSESPASGLCGVLGQPQAILNVA